MAMRIWELHGMRLDGAICTGPGGEADIDGLALSEKAYLLVMRDYRPAELVRLVQREGPEEAARTLLAHFAGQGHELLAPRSLGPTPRLLRNDEVKPVAAMIRR